MLVLIRLVIIKLDNVKISQTLLEINVKIANLVFGKKVYQNVKVKQNMYVIVSIILKPYFL